MTNPLLVEHDALAPEESLATALAKQFDAATALAPEPLLAVAFAVPFDASHTAVAALP